MAAFTDIPPAGAGLRAAHSAFEAGHLAGYRLACDDLCYTPMRIRTGKPYRLSGPDGTWYVVGMHTAGDRTEVLLVSEAEYERRMARRKETNQWLRPALSTR